MPQRRKNKPRCEGCGLPPALCACDLMPRVELQTRLFVVQHIRERFKPTNTGRLLTTMVPSVPLRHYGMREPPFDSAPFEDPSIDYRLVFPREDAVELRPGEPGLGLNVAPGKQLGFVLIDGTWHQCSRMTRRVPVVQEYPCVVLPPGPPSIWGVRTQHDERGLSTFEAALRLAGILEGEQAVEPLRRAWEEICARALFMKGRLEKPEVPQEWRDRPLWGG